MTRLGIRTRSFRAWPIERTAAELARLGYGCLELCLENDDVRPESLDEARCRQIRATLDGLGIALASVSYHGDYEPLAGRPANQERAVRITRWMGASCMVLAAEKREDVFRQWPKQVAQMARLARLAEELEVTLAVEPEPPTVVASTPDVVALMRVVGSPRLKVNLDIGHAQITDTDVIASIRRLGADIAHVHVEDSSGRVHRHLPLGEGDIDWAAVRRALDAIGYAGPIVVDLGGMDAQGTSAPAARHLEAVTRFFG